MPRQPSAAASIARSRSGPPSPPLIPNSGSPHPSLQLEPLADCAERVGTPDANLYG